MAHFPLPIVRITESLLPDSGQVESRRRPWAVGPSTFTIGAAIFLSPELWWSLRQSPGPFPALATG